MRKTSYADKQRHTKKPQNPVDLLREDQKQKHLNRLTQVNPSKLVLFLLVTVSLIPYSVVSGSVNLTPQNQRIAVFSGSYFWEPFPTELGRILNREVKFYCYEATTTPDALRVCSQFDTDPFGIIIVGFGGQDRLEGLSWEQTENALREMFRRLKNTGAVVVYNQIVPDSSPFGYNPSSQVCVEEGVILVANISEDIFVVYDPTSGLVFNPHFDEPGDNTHPNEEAYVVYAERTTKVLVENGLIQNTQICEGLSGQIPAVFSHATDLIDKIEEKGGDTQLANERYTIAQYIWDNWDHEYYYTVNRSLHQRIIYPLESCLIAWDEITELFDDANTSIITIEEKGMGREAIFMKADYSRAEKTWAEYDHDTTKSYLDKVLTKAEEIPELNLMPILPALTLLIPGLLGKTRTRHT